MLTGFRLRQVNASIENPVICHATYVNTPRSNSIAGRRLARVRPCRWALSLPRHLRLLRSARAHAGAAGHAPRDHALAGRAARSLNAAGSHRRGQVDPALRLSRQPEHSRPGRCSLKRSWCRLPASSAPTSSAIASPAGRAHSQQDGLEDGSQELVGVLLLRIRNSHKRMAEREGFEPSSGETPEPDFESGAFDHSATFPDSGALGPAHWLRLTSLARPDPSPQSYASLRIVDH